MSVPALLFLLSPSPALAHASDSGMVLLLPTGYYLAGGALAVALSFAILAALPAGPLDRLAKTRLPLFRNDESWRIILSTLSFLTFAGLVAAGFLGSRDPLSNPLPLVFWTLLWAGMALIQGVLGDVWAWINPWYAPYRLLAMLAGRSASQEEAKDRNTPGYWPAIALFLAFAWFELVYPAPEDPSRLATVLAAYFVLTLLAILVFGYSAWMRQGEAISAFFTMIARVSIFSAGRDGRVALCAPGAKLASAPSLSASGILFLLLALSSVSFDGLSRTFLWMGWIGVNPLEFPGRSAVVGVNSLGLVAMFAVLAGAFLLAVFLGERLAASTLPFDRVAGALAWSMIPISLAYHFAHNLTALLVNAQYALAAISDPLSRGWDLFGTAGLHVHAGITAGYQSAWAIWNAEALAIILGHMLAVAVAHLVAWRLHGPGRAAMLSQIPLAVLMVFYTLFGLWLLSTPTGA